MASREEKPPASNSSESSGESDWVDAEPDEELSTIVSLFDDQTFPTPAEMLAYCKDKHSFDFLGTVRRLHLDFYGAIKFVNFVRTCVQQGTPLPGAISQDDLQSEELLKPVLANDALLFNLDEVLEAGEEQDADSDPALAGSSAQDILAHNKALEEELETLRAQFSNYRLAVEQTLDRRWGDDNEAAPQKSEPKKDNSDYYFESYAAHGILSPPRKETKKQTVTDLG